MNGQKFAEWSAGELRKRQQKNDQQRPAEFKFKSGQKDQKRRKRLQKDCKKTAKRLQKQTETRTETGD